MNKFIAPAICLALFTSCLPASHADEYQETLPIARRAESLAEQGQFDQALALLRSPTVPKTIWLSYKVFGDIAGQKDDDWKTAAKHYNNALNLLDSTGDTPCPSSASASRCPELQGDIEELINLAQAAQLLAGEMDTSLSRGGETSGVMLDSVRGVGVKERPLAVRFEYNSDKFTSKDEQIAQNLVDYIKRKNFSRITLTGHTDERGSQSYNQPLSEKRANRLKDYLVKNGVTAEIKADGKGELKPFRIQNPKRFTQDQIHALNRRVEFLGE